MKLSLFPILLFFPVLVAAQNQSETQYLNLTDNKVAIHGYDPVSYFRADEPKEGSESLSYEYNGAVYYFFSEENLEIFKNNPSAYKPAYGGWCAYAMGKGYTADINPETYKILDGKLLLFYNKFLTNTLPKWNKAENMLYPAAEKNWKEKTFDQ